MEILNFVVEFINTLSSPNLNYSLAPLGCNLKYTLKKSDLFNFLFNLYCINIKKVELSITG